MADIAMNPQRPHPPINAAGAGAIVIASHFISLGSTLIGSEATSRLSTR